MELIDNKAIKLTLKNESADLVLSRIDKSELINREDEVSHIVVYWGIEEITLLNQLINFRDNLPSPIIKDYDWKGIYDPFSHQRVTS